MPLGAEPGLECCPQSPAWPPPTPTPQSSLYLGLRSSDVGLETWPCPASAVTATRPCGTHLTLPPSPLLFLPGNMLSRLVLTFLPRSKRLLISWLQSPSAVVLEPPKIKSDTVSSVSSSISHEVMGPDAMIFVF